MKSVIVAILLALAVSALPGKIQAVTTGQGEISLEQAGASLAQINAAASEPHNTALLQGTLVEIGNTTNRYTTIVLRLIRPDDNISDETIEVTPATNLKTADGRKSLLDDWIAGDQLVVRAIQGQQSGYFTASAMTNRSIGQGHKTINGWVETLDAVTNKMSVRANNQLETLDLTAARLVVGNQNPALIYDFRSGDRVRARVMTNNDKTAALAARIIVALRRGDALFMRTTRWIIPGTITEIPADLTRPLKIEVRALPSRFYQEGDINNIFGSARKFVTVVIDEQTQIRRAFKGNAAVSELAEGDQVIIIGRWDESSQTFSAKTLRDLSLQRLGSTYLYAQITAIDLIRKTVSGFVWLTPQQTETWTFTFNNSSEFYRQRNPFFVKDLALGSIVRLRVKALTDRPRQALLQRLVVMTANGTPVVNLPQFPLDR